MCSFTGKHKKLANRAKAKKATPAKLKAPISQTDPARLEVTIQQQRLKCAKLKAELAEMRIELEAAGQEVSKDLNNDILSIMSDQGQNMSPFMQLFWQEQKKAQIRSSRGYRCHPMIIRFCLSVASKSSSSYDEWRDSNVLILPSRRILRDYKNAIRPR